MYGLLPVRSGVPLYGTRPLAGVKNTVIHYTTGANTLTVDDIAAFQVGPTAPVNYPEIAYHVLIEADGTINYCHPPNKLTWNCGTGSPYAWTDTSGYKVGSNNWESFGIVFTGTNPTDAQLRSLKIAADEADVTFGRTLQRLPHRVISKGLTECPGDGYMEWWGKVA